MTEILREFLMDFLQDTGIIVNLLPEPDRALVGVHFLHVLRRPSEPASYLVPVSPSPGEQLLPLSKRPLIALTLGSVKQGIGSRPFGSNVVEASSVASSITVEKSGTL